MFNDAHHRTGNRLAKCLVRAERARRKGRAGASDVGRAVIEKCETLPSLVAATVSKKSGGPDQHNIHYAVLGNGNIRYWGLTKCVARSSKLLPQLLPPQSRHARSIESPDNLANSNSELMPPILLQRTCSAAQTEDYCSPNMITKCVI